MEAPAHRLHTQVAHVSETMEREIMDVSRMHRLHAVIGLRRGGFAEVKQCCVTPRQHGRPGTTSPCWMAAREAVQGAAGGHDTRDRLQGDRFEPLKQRDFREQARTMLTSARRHVAIVPAGGGILCTTAPCVSPAEPGRSRSMLVPAS